MKKRGHWERVYSTKQADEVSWFQRHPTLSLELISAALPDREAPILDVGGGASTLVDRLLEAGYRRLTVLDVAPAALALVQERLGARGERVSFLEGDVTTMSLPAASFALWHDRAVFHFLTDLSDRRRYVRQVRHAVIPGGLVLVATFAEDGPTRCSGLDVERYSPERLLEELGTGFEGIESTREEHVTPSGAVQPFTYCLCRFSPEARTHPPRAR